jgi:transcriptional regulator with XRE-family HTH domain
MAKPSPSYSGITELVQLGASIREKRSMQGLSQEAFADKTGLDRSYLGGIERGEHNIALVNLVKIARALGITTAELLKTAGL